VPPERQPSESCILGQGYASTRPSIHHPETAPTPQRPAGCHRPGRRSLHPPPYTQSPEGCGRGPTPSIQGGERSTAVSAARPATPAGIFPKLSGEAPRQNLSGCPGEGGGRAVALLPVACSPGTAREKRRLPAITLALTALARQPPPSPSLPYHWSPSALPDQRHPKNRMGGVFCAALVFTPGSSACGRGARGARRAALVLRCGSRSVYVGHPREPSRCRGLVGWLSAA
jgi:hypothetical protein